MPQIMVTIAGKAYRMACGEGEEAHLESLAALFNGKIDELRGAFGEIGDMRLQVMAAITVVDELTEARKRIAALEEELAGLRTRASEGGERMQTLEAQLASTLNRTAERVERLTKNLSAPLAEE